MAEGPAIETYANETNSASSNGSTPNGTAAGSDASLRRTLLFVAIAAASAGIAFAVVRFTLARAPSDPTTERIQQLIDEANRLLKTLDDKKPEE